MSKHFVRAGDAAALPELLQRRHRQAEERLGGRVRVITIQEAGLDGFWLHRLLETNTSKEIISAAESERISSPARVPLQLAGEALPPRPELPVPGISAIVRSG